MSIQKRINKKECKKPKVHKKLGKLETLTLLENIWCDSCNMDAVYIHRKLGTQKARLLCSFHAKNRIVELK